MRLLRSLGAALVAAAALAFGPADAAGQKALVYCPVGVDATGCSTLVTSLAATFPGGVDRGWDGSSSTVDLATADLSAYALFVVPSLADVTDRTPYARLRDTETAARLRNGLLGRIALWSGTPDQGTGSREQKDLLLTNLATWASADFATAGGPGLLVLQDNSALTQARYDWLSGLTGLTITADPKQASYAAVRSLNATATAIVGSGTSAIAYTNMASYGFYLPTGAAGLSLDAVGQTGTTTGGQVVLATAPAGNRGAAVVTTDRDDYAPGETVTMTGFGFGASETVKLVLTEDPVVHGARSFEVTTNEDGEFTFTGFKPEDHDLGVRFVLTATGLTSGRVAQTTFTDAVNLAAVAVTPSSQTVSPGSSAVFTVTADFNGSGTSGCTATLSVTGLPSGATATWTPSNTVSATSNVDVTRTLTIATTVAAPATSFQVNAVALAGGGGQGCNGGNVTASASLTIGATVSNQPPSLTVPAAQTITEEQTLDVSISATDDGLPSGNGLTYSLTAKPDGATIDAATGAISWDPTEAQGNGSAYTFTAQVTDGALTDTESFTVTVTEVNEAPVLAAIGNQSVDELAALTFAASATDADLPANTLTFTLVNGPAGAVISSAGAFTWTPTEAQSGPHTFTVQVSDGQGGTDSEQITVTVNEVNQAPVLGAIGNQEIDELTPLTGVTASATDSDVPANTLTYSLTVKPTGATIDAATGAISWMPAEDQDGTHAFTVQVSDGQGGSDTKSFSVEVNEVNVPPVLATIGNKEVDELTALTFTATATDSDLPANTLSYSLSGAPTGASITSAGVFSWTPAEDQDGIHTFTVQLSDGKGGTDSEDITVTVQEVNLPPVWTPVGAKSVDEETALSFTVSASDSDLPANPLTYSAVSLPTGATFDPATRTFSWTPTEAQGPGSVSVTLRVHDGTVGVDETFSVTVNEVNRNPVLAAIGNQTTNELEPLSGVSASATDPDIPANVLTYSLTVKPDGMTINASTGAITWTPTELQDGVHSVTVQVSDGNGGTDAKSFQVTVAEVNVPPTLAAIAARSVNEGSPVESFTATALDPDVIGGQPQALTYSIPTMPANVTGTAHMTPAGVFTWTPVDDDPTNTGSDLFTFVVQVRDAAGATDTENALVTVINVAPAVVGSVVVPTDPVPTTTKVAASVDFTDVGTADTHATTSMVQWDVGLPFEKHGEGGTAISVSGGKLTATKSLPAGIYTITIKVVDDDTGESGAVASTTYVVVYDPSGGFVTGGGWINSPAGAYLANPSAAGRAHFGFNSKYQKGATIPTGNTEFQFKAGELDFKSSKYEWLVVSSFKAQYKGEGTIQGRAGTYMFLLSAVDGQVNGGGGTDKFRIKIWDKATGAVVYDNQGGAADDATATTVLGGGSIVIHGK